MRDLPAINLEQFVRSLGSLLLIALVLVLAWRGTGWLWYFAAPAPNPPVPDLRSLVSVSNVARFPWFGAPLAGPAAMAPASDIRVIGLFAGGARPMALLVIGTQNPTAVTVGESPAPGLQVVSIAGDHVVVRRNGIDETILLTGATAANQRNTRGKRGNQ